MKPGRILATATAIEGCLLMAALAPLGAGGAWSHGLDLLNCAAPLFLAVALGSTMAAHVLLDRGRFRTVCVAAGLVSAVFNLGLVLPEMLAVVSQPHMASQQSYRLVTANVFHANDRSYHAARDVVARGADAVLMQEADGTISLADWIFAKTYPYSSRCPGAGVRIWTKTPILAQGCGAALPIGSPLIWEEDFVWIRTLGPRGQPITLATLHLPHPYPTDGQAIELRAIAGALAILPRDQLVLAGDFNTAPWTFAMRRQDDLMRPLQRRTFFWWSWPARINVLSKPWSLPFLPIDHIYTGSGWGQVGLTRFRVTGSDHFATEAVLDQAE